MNVIFDIKRMNLESTCEDLKEKDFYTISHIHNEQGYKAVRAHLAATYNRSKYVPDIQAFQVAVMGD